MNGIVVSMLWGYSPDVGIVHLWAEQGKAVNESLHVFNLMNKFAREVTAFFQKVVQKEVIQSRMPAIGEFLIEKVDFEVKDGNLFINTSQAVYTKNTQAHALMRQFDMLVHGLVKFIREHKPGTKEFALEVS